MALPDPEEVNIQQDIIPATGLIYAPTSGKPYQRGPRPRALLMGWTPDDDNPGFGTISVVFRDAGGRIYNYYNVPQMMWQQLSTTDSTGDFLRTSGIEDYDRGFVDGSTATYQKVTAARRKEWGRHYGGLRGALGAPKKLLGKPPTQ